MRHLLDSVVTFVSWHRRAVGALLAALAVLLVAQSLSSPAETVPVVTLTADVPAGVVLTRRHLALSEVQPESVPAGAITDLDAALGEAVAVTLGSGSVLQPGLLVRGEGIAPGRAVVPISVRDAGLRQLLRPGDAVSLVGAGGESLDVVTRDARVVGLPSDDAVGSAVEMASAREAEVVLVDVPGAEAPMIAALGQNGQLSIVLGSI